MFVTSSALWRVQVCSAGTTYFLLKLIQSDVFILIDQRIIN